MARHAQPDHHQPNLHQSSPRPTVAELPGLLAALRVAVSRPRPELELVRLLVKLTGGYAELRASWGQVVASAGKRGDDPQTFKLLHLGRHVGQLTVDVPAQWQALAPVAAEYALLARLQSAAAGAARRRVSERLLDDLLDSQRHDPVFDEDSFVVAVGQYTEVPARGAVAQAAYAHALDVLASVGEGYFTESRLRGLCAVRERQVVWLWPVGDVQQEAAELFLALSASTGRSVQLGISQPHQGSSVSPAYLEAQEALSRCESSGYTIFTQPDAFYTLLRSDALQALRLQVLAQLQAADDHGKVQATLKAFLAHSGTLEELADQQRIHVNTLRYRLKVAEKAVKGSLNDPMTISRLYLALGPS